MPLGRAGWIRPLAAIETDCACCINGIVHSKLNNTRFNRCISGVGAYGGPANDKRSIAVFRYSKIISTISNGVG